MHDTKRRQCVRWRLSRWLLSPGALVLLLAVAGAQGQHEAAVEAMGPPTISGPVATNPIAPPEVAHLPNDPAVKQRVRLASASTPSAPTAPTPGSPGVTPPVPGAPANVLAPPPAGQEKPAPLENPDQVRITADRFGYTGGATTAEGHVEVRYQDLTIRGAAAELDKERVWGGFRGDVHLQAKLYSALADRLRVNLETEDFSGQNVAATLTPEFFRGQVAAPIYVRAGEVVGRPDRVTATEAIGTSCDRWPDPHWMLQSDRITVVPDQWVSFARPTLYLYGHRILRYPWDLHLSLKRSDNRFLPEVGQNAVEGYYAKFAYGYAINDANTGFLRLHLTQKRGVGFGFDHILDESQQWAELSVFTEPEVGSISGQLLHRGQYSKPLSSNLSVSLQQNSGFGFASQALNGDLTFRYDTPDAQSLLGFQQSLISSGVSTSRRFSSNFNYRQRVGKTGSWEVRSSYYESSFLAGQPADQELETQLTWRQDFHAFTSQFAAERRFDIDASRYLGDSSFFRLDRLPDWTLTTDSNRLGDFRIFGRPLEATVYLGDFTQHPDELNSYRVGADLRLTNITNDFGDRATLRTSLRFRQMFYTAAAQWIGELRSEYLLRLPGHWETRLSYNYATPNGFSPLRMDFASPVNAGYFNAVCLMADRMRINISFGRDFQNDYYQDAILRGEFLLSPRNRIELQGGYSVQLSRPRPLNLRWVYATERTWWSALTVNYNLERSELTNLSLDVDWWPSLLWRVQFLGGLSSFGGLDRADVRITRDLHCMLAQLAYVHATNEIRLGFGVKAFPSATRAFGVGARGQYFESNFGDVY